VGNRAPDATGLNNAGSIPRRARHGPSLGIFGLVHRGLSLDLANNIFARCCSVASNRSQQEEQSVDSCSRDDWLLMRRIAAESGELRVIRSRS
jgi:hypothetical protein